MLEATTGTALRLAFARLAQRALPGDLCSLGPLGPDKRARLIALAAESRCAGDLLLLGFSDRGGIDVVWRRLPRSVPPRRRFRR